MDTENNTSATSSESNEPQAEENSGSEGNEVSPDTGTEKVTEGTQSVKNISLPNPISTIQKHIQEATEFVASFTEHYEKFKTFLDTRNDQSAMEQMRALKELIIDSPYVGLIPIPYFQDVLSTASDWFLDTLDFFGIYDLEEARHDKFKKELLRTKLEQVLHSHNKELNESLDNFKRHLEKYQNTPLQTLDKFIEANRKSPENIYNIELNSRLGDGLETYYFKRKKRTYSR